MTVSIWPGSSSFFPGMTPFGFYDNDYQFQVDIDRFAIFAARRLGYPIVEVELQDINFYAAFEEAITTYGNEVYAYKIRQDYLDVEGAPTGSSFNNALITPNMANIIRISEQYGTEAGTGGNVTWYQGSLPLTASVQTYDLDVWATQNGISGSDLEIRRIFYEAPPAITKYFDPYAGTGTGMMNLIDSFGWGNYSPAINFLLMPFNFDLQKIQAIELNDQIRKSNYSFELINNKLRIFPIPGHHHHTLFFQYMKKSEKYTSNIGTNPGIITNVSNVPYRNPMYTQINSIGKSWIFEYALALCKEMLGYVRGKYTSLPIPGNEVTLNSGDLITAAANERLALITKLQKYLEETSREKIMERKKIEDEYLQNKLGQVPYLIYVG
jgi:hypothetical protein